MKKIREEHYEMILILEGILMEYNTALVAGIEFSDKMLADLRAYYRTTENRLKKALALEQEKRKHWVTFDDTGRAFETLEEKVNRVEKALMGGAGIVEREK